MKDQCVATVETTFELFPPIMVNAAAQRISNTILIPAGILQAPLFDVNTSDEENFSGIGAIIGHEISHVFDDQGAQYDSKGNVRDWWTPADYKSYMTR